MGEASAPYTRSFLTITDKILRQNMSSIIALAIHAEKLHDDRLWQRVNRLAQRIAQKDFKATFFVYPYRAQVAGKDISNRIKTLAEFGHEIGQHTHFYADDKIDKPEKKNDFSKRNVGRCLTRDFETLCAAGIKPKGFTAGGWKVNNFVLDGLIDLGFIYDCTARFPKPKLKESTLNAWLVRPRLYRNERGKLWQIPTTCSLGEFFKWGRKRTSSSRVPYYVVYFHDYDLSSFRHYIAVSIFLFFIKKSLVSVIDLSENIAM